MKEEYGYDPFLDISPSTTLIQFKDCLDGIHNYYTVVGKWIFDSDFPFSLPLTKENLDQCCINYNEIIIMNGYKGLLKSIRFFTKDTNKGVIQK